MSKVPFRYLALLQIDKHGKRLNAPDHKILKAPELLVNPDR